MRKMDDWKPNLFVPGFPKCGTTALCDYLAQHPDIYVIEGKEPSTLSDVNDDNCYPNLLKSYPHWHKLKKIVVGWSKSFSFNEYKNLFLHHIDKRYRVDGSQPYSFTEDNILALKNFNPDAKILLMIRESKRVLISYYFYFYEFHKYNFKDYLNKIVIPNINDLLFYDRCNLFINLFGINNVRVIDNKTLLKDPQEVMNKIFDFLGIKRINIEHIISNPSITNPLLLNVDGFIFNLVYSTRDTLEKTGLLNTRLHYILKKGLIISRTIRTTIKKIEKKKIRNGIRYDDLLREIPEEISKILDSDYNRTIEYCRERGLLIE